MYEECSATCRVLRRYGENGKMRLKLLNKLQFPDSEKYHKFEVFEIDLKSEPTVLAFRKARKASACHSAKS